jgi:hypothetical protein
VAGLAGVCRHRRNVQEIYRQRRLKEMIGVDQQEEKDEKEQKK